MDKELSQQSNMVMMIFKFFLQSKEYSFFVRRLKNVAMTRTTVIETHKAYNQNEASQRTIDYPKFTRLASGGSRDEKDPGFSGLVQSTVSAPRWNNPDVAAMSEAKLKSSQLIHVQGDAYHQRQFSFSPQVFSQTASHKQAWPKEPDADPMHVKYLE